MSHYNHIKEALDLKTTRSEIRAGFVRMALEKSRRAMPFIDQARALKHLVRDVKKPSDLLETPNIIPALLTASGLSDKAKNHLDEKDKKEAVQKLIENFLTPAGDNFIDELIYRFLLIKGDSFGGAIRNIAGYLAEQRFKRFVVAALNVQQKSFSWLSKKSGKWIRGHLLNNDIDDTVGFCWKNNNERILIFNKKNIFVKKNIDVCLLASNYTNLNKSMHVVKNYLAFGEIKGGIDPAGADEHWKTAKSALERISDSFHKKSHKTHSFFVGAAIESVMAEEIWEWLKLGKLATAGNLTDEKHVAAVCSWLVEL